MRVAIWRYGLPFQLDSESTVGGGLLARSVVEYFTGNGHEVHLVGKVAKGAAAKVGDLGATADASKDILGFDLAVILTGPFNPLYGDAVFDTYRMLAGYTGKVVYAQWDNALPFHFAPSCKVGGMPELVDRLWANKRWYLLTQVGAQHVRNTRNRSTGYATAPFTHIPCFWELAEAGRKPLSVCTNPVDAIGYFGSDRPGRVAELKRLLCGRESPPVHLYGRWSKASLGELSNNVVYKGAVPEAEVAATLNAYRATLYAADPLYITQDFIAQRFFENASAAVPVIYSNLLQPTLASVVKECAPSAAAVRAQYDALEGGVARLANVLDTRKAVAQVAQLRSAHTIERAFQRVLED